MPIANFFILEKGLLFSTNSLTFIQGITYLTISGRCKTKLCKESVKANATSNDLDKYKTYRNNYNKAKHALKLTYYQNKAKEFANDTKKLWDLLNQVIGKTKNKGCIIPYITIDGLKTYTPSKIANEFGKYYATVGEIMACKIGKGQHDIDHYITKIPRNLSSLVFRFTNVVEIESIINGIPNKTSHSHHSISNILLK